MTYKEIPWTTYDVDPVTRFISNEQGRRLKDIFADLKAFLKEREMVPDEYFLGPDDGEMQFPLDGVFVAYVNYGSSEGIYLDIEIRSRKHGTIHFATGKTLRASGDAYDFMYDVACTCSKALNGAQFSDVPVRRISITREERDTLTALLNITPMETKFKTELLSKLGPLFE